MNSVKLGFVKRNDYSCLRNREILVTKYRKFYFRGRKIDGMYFPFSNDKPGS